MKNLTEAGAIILSIILLGFIVSFSGNQQAITLWGELLKIAISGFIGYITRGVVKE